MSKIKTKNKNCGVDIFIYSHKPFKPKPTNKVFKVLTCYKGDDEEFNTSLDILRDYTGDNISNENLMYNEYCGFYWLWKNYPLKDYVGLNHYRRYYDNYENLPDISKIFSDYDIILNKRLDLKFNDGKPYNNREWYAFWHNVEDFDILEELIHEKYPDYIDGFDEMKNCTYIYPSSMFIMDKSTFNEYCEFIFSVLKDYREKCGYNTVDDCIRHVEANKDKYIKPHLPYYTVEMQSRIIGYIAERVLLTFLKHKREDGTSLEEKAYFFRWTLYN